MDSIYNEITDIELLTDMLNTAWVDIDSKMAVAERLTELGHKGISRLFYMSIVRNPDIEQGTRYIACRLSGGHELRNGDCTCLKCGMEDHSPYKDRNHNEAEFMSKYTELSYSGACSHCGKIKVNYVRDGKVPCYKCDGKGIAKSNGTKLQSNDVCKEGNDKCMHCDGTGEELLKNALHTVWVAPGELETMENSLK